MVPVFLITALLLAALPAWGQDGAESCRACHPSHYAAKGSCTACHGGNPRSGRKNIAHQGIIGGRYAHFSLGSVPQVREGERLIDQYACRRCHHLAGRGNRLAVSLDLVPARRSAGDIAAAIRRPVPGMPAFGLDEDEIAKVVNALFHGAHQKRATAGAPQRVHFAAPANRGEDIFSLRCGPCHRALTEQLGAIGTGAAGPNLSGLFSRHYLQTNSAHKGWTEKRLLTWVNNPRAVEPLARMRPVMLSAREAAELRRILQLTAPEETRYDTGLAAGVQFLKAKPVEP